MWLRDFRSPPKALALFQVYHRFAPLTDFRGLTWRIQVDQDVCMQAFLVAGPPQGSFLHVRRGPTLVLQPPLLRIEGQLEAPYLNELPLEAWIAQGTRWWLRNLGSVLVDKPLRLTLLNALVDMDRSLYPELEAAIAYHPIIPLVNGDWISLEQLRTYPQVFQSRSWAKGWHGGVPVIQTGGALDQIQELLDQPVVALEGPPRAEPKRWYYPLDTEVGQLTLTLLGQQHTPSSNWVIGRSSEPHFRVTPLFDDNPLALTLTCDYRGVVPDAGVPVDLRKAAQQTVVQESSSILLSLQHYPDRLHEICSLLILMLKSDLQPPEAIWALHYDIHHNLGHLRDGKARPTSGFDLDHPIFQLAPGKLNFAPCAQEPTPRTDLFQLHWTQQCQNQEIRLQFLARRDGLSTLTTHHPGERVDQTMIGLWEDWPLSLAIRLLDEVPPGQDWTSRLKDSLEKHLATPLQLLRTYPEALEEVCCLVGIGLQSGRRPPGWIWDFQDLSGKALGELVQGPCPEYATQHPLNRLQKLLKR